MKLYLTGLSIACTAVAIALWVQPGTAEIEPRAYCLMWNWRLIGSLAVSDGTIWASYMAIPFILYRYRAKLDIPEWLIAFFVAFIFFCGVGHLLDLITYWHPIYPVKAAGNFITSVVSVGTVVGLALNREWLNRPTRKQMDAAVEKLVEANLQMQFWKQSYETLAPEIDRLSGSLEEVMAELGMSESGRK